MFFFYWGPGCASVLTAIAVVAVAFILLKAALVLLAIGLAIALLLMLAIFVARGLAEDRRRREIDAAQAAEAARVAALEARRRQRSEARRAALARSVPGRLVLTFRERRRRRAEHFAALERLAERRALNRDEATGK